MNKGTKAKIQKVYVGQQMVTRSKKRQLDKFNVKECYVSIRPNIELEALDWLNHTANLNRQDQQPVQPEESPQAVQIVQAIPPVQQNEQNQGNVDFRALNRLNQPNPLNQPKSIHQRRQSVAGTNLFSVGFDTNIQECGVDHLPKVYRQRKLCVQRNQLSTNNHHIDEEIQTLRTIRTKESGKNVENENEPLQNEFIQDDVPAEDLNRLRKYMTFGSMKTGKSDKRVSDLADATSSSGSNNDQVIPMVHVMGVMRPPNHPDTLGFDGIDAKQKEMPENIENVIKTLSGNSTTLDLDNGHNAETTDIELNKTIGAEKHGDKGDIGDSLEKFEDQAGANRKPGKPIIDPFRRLAKPGFSLYGRRRSITVLSEIPEYSTWNPKTPKKPEEKN